MADKHMARIWKRKLVNAGFTVVVVFATARAAWQALRKSPPDAAKVGQRVPLSLQLEHPA